MDYKKVAFLLAILLSQLSAYGQQPGGTSVPLFDYASRQDFAPDITPALRPPVDVKITENTNSLQSVPHSPAQPAQNSQDYKFQVADPKGIFIPDAVVREKPATTLQPAIVPSPTTETSQNSNIEQALPEDKLRISAPCPEPLETKLPSQDQAVSVTVNEIKQPEPAVNTNSSNSNTTETQSLHSEQRNTIIEMSPQNIPETSPPNAAVNAPPCPVSENSDGDTNQTSQPPENIDYYMKKYDSALQAQANVNEFKYSLMEPFKQSLFYKVLLENKNENIEIQTMDVTADFQPEGIVSYNIPLGAEGEYATQILVLQPCGPDLNKLWVSEQIPGKMDSVMIQDVNNDTQNDIVAVSTAGGVSLLKSIRVYSYSKERCSFETIFAMNGIMEGIVSVKPGKILVSETFPGGINRAALYVWNGKRFERLEL